MIVRGRAAGGSAATPKNGDAMGRISRREMMKTLTSLGGFALAGAPLAARALETPAEGLTVGEVNIPAAGGIIPAYRAVRRGARRPPIMIVAHEIFAVHDHIKDVCRRFAHLGYLALAPNLFARQGDVSKLKELNDILTRVVGKVPDKQVMGDLDACYAWARTDGRADEARTGLIGFGWGGRATWLYAARTPDLRAAVSFYGRLSGDKNENTPRNPIDIVPDLDVPVLGIYGGADPAIPVGFVSDLQIALKRAQKPSIVRIYPAAGHGFFAEYRSSFRREDAADAWNETQDWFARFGLQAPRR